MPSQGPIASCRLRYRESRLEDSYCPEVRSTRLVLRTGMGGFSLWALAPMQLQLEFNGTAEGPCIQNLRLVGLA